MPDPVTQTIHFSLTGGAVSVTMLGVPAAPGHYSLMLLEHDRTTIVKDFGNNAFSTQAKNTHQLPGPVALLDGRILLAQTSLAVVDTNVAPIMTVGQDKSDLGSVTDPAASSDQTKESELVINLSGQQTVNASAANLLASAKVPASVAANPDKRSALLRKLTVALLKKEGLL